VSRRGSAIASNIIR